MDISGFTRTFYEKRIHDVRALDQPGSRAQEVGWASDDIQLITFAEGTDLAHVDWKNVRNVLDIGCGYGNLAEYLREEKGFTGVYTGVDIVAEFIDVARESYGEDPKNRFILGDALALDWGGEQTFDVVLCFGALTVNHDQPAPYAERSLAYADQLVDAMLRLGSQAIAMHFPSEDNMTDKQRELNPDMAFYKPRYIEYLLREAAGSRLQELHIGSYPDATDVRTMARLTLKSSQV